MLSFELLVLCCGYIDAITHSRAAIVFYGVFVKFVMGASYVAFGLSTDMVVNIL